MTPLRLAPHSNGRSRKCRVFVGGICWDNGIVVKTLKLGKKNPIVHRVRTQGGGARTMPCCMRTEPSTECVLLRARWRRSRGTGTAGLHGRAPRSHALAAGAEHDDQRKLRDHGRGQRQDDDPQRRGRPHRTLAARPAGGPAARCGGLLAWFALGQRADRADRACLLGRAGAAGFRLGRRQINDLGYEALRAVLAADVQLIMCNREEARQLTGEDNVAAQLDA